MSDCIAFVHNSASKSCAITAHVSLENPGKQTLEKEYKDAGFTLLQAS